MSKFDFSDTGPLDAWMPKIGSSFKAAVLQDNGNFVLKDGSNSPRILWQSFEHPTNTWLPGCKFGYNNMTKTNQRLVSWKNSEDPSPGLYTLELDTSSSTYKILWNRSKNYWNSGPWNGRIFDTVPEMNSNPIFEFTYITNINESYFIYYVKGNSTKYPRAVMDVSGQLKQLNWLPTKQWNAFWSQPRQQCEVPYFCGAYGICNEMSLPFCNCLMGFEPKLKSFWDLEDYSHGCQRKTKLNCENINDTGNGKRDKFLEMSSMSLPEAQQYVTAGSEAVCKAICLNNCSCTAYAFDSNKCLIWVGELLNLKQFSAGESKGEILYVRLAASELRSSRKSNGRVIGAVVGGASGLAVLLGLIILVILRQRKKIFSPGKAVVEGSLYYVNGDVSFFPTWAASIIIGGGDVFSLLDPRLEGNADPEELIRVCRVACWCVQREETQRPSMGQIVQILEGILNVNLPPLPRSFPVFVDNSDPEYILFTESSSSRSILSQETVMSTATS
ncbi:hypothetical protein FEM48_Zijuj04G0079200 [Ziziphus jujuba var. spinosa]|uniref:Apple domain-containing protein n=1 Tax=Ziziphus jujuba var. spinosa TaxID=714518 RepID=A0A978VIP5_ZIZJJ|nr:hypothetical protein FEM48_Zijuj04G0079200 [Ziziphus jujuba var. spinosa]